LSFEELITLNLADFNSARDTLKIRDRDLKISTDLAMAIKKFLKSQRASFSSGSISLNLNDPLFVSSTLNYSSIKRLSPNELLKILSAQDLKNSFLKRSRIIHLIEDGLNSEQIEELLAIKISDFFRPFFKDKSYRLLSAYNQFHPRAKLSNKP
jgi:site-specific recombinase XerD